MLFRSLTTMILFVTFGAIIPAAQAIDFIELEQAYEVNASQLRVPRAGVGNLLVETCEDCKKLRFQITGKTRVFLGTEQISIKQFRNLASANDAPAYVFYKPETYEVTRLVLDMPGLN